MRPASTLACSWSLPGSRFLQISLTRLTPRVISPVTTGRNLRRHQRLVAALLSIALYRSTEESLTEMARQYHVSCIRRKGGLLVLSCGSRVTPPPAPEPHPRPLSSQERGPEARGRAHVMSAGWCAALPIQAIPMMSLASGRTRAMRAPEGKPEGADSRGSVGRRPAAAAPARGAVPPPG